MAGLDVEYGKISNIVYINLMWNELLSTQLLVRNLSTLEILILRSFDFRIFILVSTSF